MGWGLIWIILTALFALTLLKIFVICSSVVTTLRRCWLVTFIGWVRFALLSWRSPSILLKNLKGSPTKKRVVRAVFVATVTVYCIWKGRNSRCFRRRALPSRAIISSMASLKCRLSWKISSPCAFVARLLVS